MAVKIDQLLDYLDHHPICYYADNVNSLLGMLYDIYAKHNSMDSEKMDNLCRNLSIMLDKLSIEDKAKCMAWIHDSTREHEQIAFIHGFVVGLCLMTEIRTVV